MLDLKRTCALVGSLRIAAIIGLVSYWHRGAIADVGAISAGDCDTFVSTSGDDAAGDGSSDAPWRHINYALSQASPGSVVCLRGGTYRELVSFPTSGMSDSLLITLAGDPTSSEAVIDGTIAESVGGQLVDYIENPCVCPPAVQVLDASHVRVTGLTIKNRGNARYTNPGPGSQCGAGVAGECSAQGIGILATTGADLDDIVVDHCTITDVRPPYAAALGIPISVGASYDGSVISQLQITGNSFGESDTQSVSAGETSDTGLIGIMGSIENFLISGNTFADSDSVGIDFGGNQTPGAYPSQGVIRGNSFSNSVATENYAVQIQAARQVLVERNYFHNVGRGIAVTTEPPCDVTPYVLAGRVWIRNNIFWGTQTQDMVTGAYDNSADIECPNDAYPYYLSTEDVWFTNNTIYRIDESGDPLNASISVVSNGVDGLTGDSIIFNNVFISADRIFDITTADLASDHNAFVFLGTGNILPFKAGSVEFSWSQWAGDRDGRSEYTTTNPYFDSPSGPSDFHLVSDWHLIGSGIQVPDPNESPQRWPVTLGSTAFGSFTPPVEYDFYGGTRTNGTRDIGADEY
jgi:hypothetical protein